MAEEADHPPAQADRAASTAPTAGPGGGAPLVRRDTRRGIAVLTLDSPANRNALSARLRADLAAGLAAAMADDSVRAVLLTGAGPAFCAGADLKEIEAERAGHPPAVAAPGMHELFGALLEAPKPVVARLNGPARAGGIGLVAAADIAVAPDDVTFAFTEVRIGVVPAIISLPVALRMHNRQLARYFLTGETFDAATAAAAGLVTAAVPRADLDTATESVLDGLRAAAPRALRATKELLAGIGAVPPDERAAELARLAGVSAEYFASADAAEGRAAFLRKRTPKWVL
ncbi:enoyl-CoA hydratase-related protein [Streptomonospora nanhaiensis]|uniref:Methylglutaconyl-CoA hydratase n=1 Tax=Streptomonospora nanhaiensis TaxID=1323731 RepID=A0A853BVZ9_9ACTN|nr:enoyl-CoA hydratase-related protein [Streptomonospora nanhaiensis]MBV2363627.1 enoyl-CoA hydratase/isomerase family protein [Streptomonospora nanhaiensis]MBX9390026.1 enoyl-CoA hydratase/isomerase family protein [Streptomonospora nanhaiensis]NYI98671.1 methylglutaconyl-CoA hydratase [Streptomonospora nanhaiensis]